MDGLSCDANFCAAVNTRARGRMSDAHNQHASLCMERYLPCRRCRLLACQQRARDLETCCTDRDCLHTNCAIAVASAGPRESGDEYTHYMTDHDAGNSCTGSERPLRDELALAAYMRMLRHLGEDAWAEADGAAYPAC